MSADALRAADQNSEAIDGLELALLYEDELEPELAAEIRLKLADCHWERSEHDAAREMLRPLLVDPLDDVWEARANVRLGRACHFRGDLDSGETLSRSAVDALGPTAHHAELAMALQWLGNTLQEFGRIEEARETYRDAVAASRRSRDSFREAALLGSLAGLDIRQSEYARAIERFETSRDLSIRIGHRSNLAKSRLNLAICWFHLGRWDRSDEELRRAEEIQTSLGNKHGLALAHVLRARLARRRGEDPSDHLDRATQIAEEIDLPRIRWLAQEERGNLALAARDLELAESLYLGVYEEARNEAPDGDMVYSVAWRLALAVLERGRTAEAETYATGALDGARRASDRREAGRCLVALSQIHDRCRQPEKAWPEISEALRVFTELQTPWELAQAHETAAELYRHDALRQRTHQAHATRLRNSLGFGGGSEAPASGLDFGTDEMVAADPASLRLLETARDLWKFDGIVLIQGETGVGKGRIARLIHESAPYATAPFVRNPARGEETQGEGTVFLDDVDKTSHAAQVDMLRMIERHREHSYGTRIVAATGRDLSRLVEAGQFLPELYYRLAGFVLEVSPLRRRPDDIEALARAFLGESGHELSDDARTALRNYTWPGNVRELANAIESAAFRAGAARKVCTKHLPASVERGEGETSGHTLPAQIEALERRQIRAALDLTGGNKKQAAQVLGVSRKGLHDRLHRLGMFEPARPHGEGLRHGGSTQVG